MDGNVSIPRSFRVRFYWIFTSYVTFVSSAFFVLSYGLFIFSISCTFWILFRSTSFQDTQHYLYVTPGMVRSGVRKDKFKASRKILQYLQSVRFTGENVKPAS